MTEILLSARSLSPNQLQGDCGLSDGQLSGHHKPTFGIWGNRPYLIGGTGSPADTSVMTWLNCIPPQSKRNLAELGASLGGDNLQAVANLQGQLMQQWTPNAIGGGGELYGRRAGQFLDAAKRYERTLLDYRAVMLVKASPAERQAAKKAVLAAARDLNTGFQNEMAATTRDIRLRAHRGTPLTDVNRGLNIARSSRTATRLNVSSIAAAQNLSRFAKYGRYLGNGVVVIDFGSRIGNIETAYDAGGDWERELFIESASFATATIAGGLVLKGGLGFLMMATPVGWVGLIIGGLAVATVIGTSAAIAVGTDYYVKKNAGSWYDEIMAVVGSLWD